jgi:phage terminase large subunit-like protein
MCEMTLHGFQGQGSPDRVDALVWALSELMLKPHVKSIKPRMRLL